MKKEGFLIDYPGAPPGGHFYFAFASIHEDSQIDLDCETTKSSVDQAVLLKNIDSKLIRTTFLTPQDFVNIV